MFSDERGQPFGPELTAEGAISRAALSDST